MTTVKANRLYKGYLRHLITQISQLEREIMILDQAKSYNWKQTNIGRIKRRLSAIKEMYKPFFQVRENNKILKKVRKKNATKLAGNRKKTGTEVQEKMQIL